MDKTSRIFQFPLLCALAAVCGLSLCGCGKSPDHLQAATDGALAMQGGDYAEAARLFAIAAKSDRATADLHYNLGVALDKAGKPAEAANAFRRALALDQGHLDATEYLALLVYRGGDSRGAAKLLEPILPLYRKSEDRARALNSLARMEIDNGTDGPALLRLLEAKRLAPSYAPSYYNLSKLYDKRFALHGEAASLMDRFTKLATEDDPLLPEAMDELRRLRAIPPPPHPAPKNETAAKRLIKQGDDSAARSRFTNAGDLYQEALDKNPGSYEAAYKLANVRYRMRRYAEAEAACRRAAENAPALLDPVYLEALIAYNTGETGKALTLLTTKAIPLWPSDPLPYQLTAYALAKLGRQTEALPYARAHIELARAKGEQTDAFAKWVRSFAPTFRAD